ncbi:MAG: sulfurtransferase [Nitrospinae bacterium]|nr:sulfurtransferase [Nitrospinota bacterium]
MTDKGYANPQLLWTPAELHGRLNDSKLCLIDTRTGEEYSQGHIPGAQVFDLFGISLSDTDPAPLKAFSWMIEYLMSFRGVAFDKTVVFYGDTSDVRAARGFWFLEYFGHPDAHVLDGGIRAWREAGYPVTTEARVAKQAKFEAKLQPQSLATYRDIMDRLNTGNVAILDVRTDGEYLGTSLRAARGGTIPGAIHLEWVHNLDASGCFRPADELRKQYEALGITPDKEVVCF